LGLVLVLLLKQPKRSGGGGARGPAVQQRLRFPGGVPQADPSRRARSARSLRMTASGGCN